MHPMAHRNCWLKQLQAPPRPLPFPFPRQAAGGNTRPHRNLLPWVRAVMGVPTAMQGMEQRYETCIGRQARHT